MSVGFGCCCSAGVGSVATLSKAVVSEVKVPSTSVTVVSAVSISSEAPAPKVNHAMATKAMATAAMAMIIQRRLLEGFAGFLPAGAAAGALCGIGLGVRPCGGATYAED